MNNEFLNNINKELLPKLSNSFFKQINGNQFYATKKKIITDLVKLRKIHNFNPTVLKYFYKEHFCNFNEIKDIIYLLSKSGKEFEYLTIDNFIHLDKFIGNKELDHLLDKLRKFRFSNEDTDINTSFHKGILNYNDILNYNEKAIIHDEIKYRIDNYLSDGENYDLLKAYCIKCCDKNEDREVMITTLKNIVNNPTYNIYEKISHFKILEILVFVDKIKENQLNYYIELLKLIKEMNNIELEKPSEFDVLLLFFSEIINKGLFKIDLLEIIAEENYSNMKCLLKTFYTGTEKNAIPEYLRNLHVKIINDYLGILKKKYNIQDDILINKIQNIAQDKENMDLKLSIFLKSINKNEKLYFDLMLQSIVESSTLEKNVESKANACFKYIRDIGITVISAKCASLTGSKVLTTISAGLGVAKILKNIKEDVVKSYFSLPDNQRKIYLKNQRTTPQRTSDLIKKKFKEQCKKIIIPLKKFVKNVIREKILKINDDSKIGFDKLDFNFKDKENLKKECYKYRENDIVDYFENAKSMIEPQYNEILYEIKEKLKTKYCIKRKKSEKLNKFFNVKQKMINHLITQKKIKLQKDYPEFDRASFGIGNLKSFCVGLYNGFISSFLFNLIDLRIKDSKPQIIEKLLRGIKEAEYNVKLEEFKKYETECSISTIKDDIQFLVKSTSDEKIFNLLEDKKVTDEQHIILLKNKFITDIQEKTDLLIENDNNNIKTIKNNEENYDYDDKSEDLIKLNESLI